MSTRAAGVLAMVTRALHSVNAGIDPREQICRDIDALVGSVASVYVVARGPGAVQRTAASVEGLPEPALVTSAVRLLRMQARPFRFGSERPGACLPLCRTRVRTSAVVLEGHVADEEVLHQAGQALREVDRLMEGWSPNYVVPLSLLTPRELEVLTLLAEGLLARTIAVRLHLSPRTVHHHLGSIYDKLDVRDRLGAVLRAREQGLLLSGPRPTGPGSPRPLEARSPALRS